MFALSLQTPTSTGWGFCFSPKKDQAERTGTTWLRVSEGDKYVSMGAGGYIARSKVNDYLAGSKEIEKQYKLALKENKQRKENIAYELANHEAFYTGEIDDTLEHLGEGYTREEVIEVYKKEKNRRILEEEKNKSKTLNCNN